MVAIRTDRINPPPVDDAELALLDVGTLYHTARVHDGLSARRARHLLDIARRLLTRLERIAGPEDDRS